jgi:hypothetical protein
MSTLNVCQDKTRQDKTRPGKARQDDKSTARQHNTRQGNARQDITTRGKTAQYNTPEHKTTQSQSQGNYHKRRYGNEENITKHTQDIFRKTSRRLFTRRYSRQVRHSQNNPKTRQDHNDNEKRKSKIIRKSKA